MFNRDVIGPNEASKVRQEALTVKILSACAARCQRGKLHKFSEVVAQQISKTCCGDVDMMISSRALATEGRI